MPSYDEVRLAHQFKLQTSELTAEEREVLQGNRERQQFFLRFRMRRLVRRIVPAIAAWL